MYHMYYTASLYHLNPSFSLERRGSRGPFSALFARRPLGEGLPPPAQEARLVSLFREARPARRSGGILGVAFMVVEIGELLGGAAGGL